MNHGPDGRPAARWVAWVQRRALAVVLLALLLGGATVGYVMHHLSVDTDTENMLSPQLPWRQAERALSQQFPNLDEGLAVVIDAPTPEAADATQLALVTRLRSRPDLFTRVFAAETEPFFRRSGLLYLSADALDALSQQLNTAQPFLATLARDPSLRGLAQLLGQAMQHPEAASLDLSPALQGLADGVGAAVDGRTQTLSWQSLMSGGGSDAGLSALQPGKRRFIAAAPVRDFSQLSPAAAPIAYIREQVAALQAEPSMAGVRVRLTGSVALEHEELLSAFGGMRTALIAAMLLVAVLLFLALRSPALVIAAVITLVYGLLLTAGFAALAVGHLNLISIAFGLLYVGLGIDYALYLCMQYRELRAQGQVRGDALPRAAGEVGGFMLVCALTTSIGFFAFIPTSFSGIAELGLIAGVGMFVSFATSLTLLPALIALLPAGRVRPRAASADVGVVARVLAMPYRHARLIRIGAVVVGLIAIALAVQARFDADPLDLRDPHSESVATFRDLLRDPALPPLTLSALAPDAAQARELSQRLSKLPQVSRAYSLPDLIPDDQADKLGIIDDLKLSLDLPPMAAASTATVADERAAAQALAAALAASPQPAAAALATQLRRFDQAAAGADGGEVVKRLHDNLFGSLPAQLAQLHELLQAQAVTEADLPPLLRARYRSANGEYRVEIWPREAQDSPEAMARFVDAVRTVAPGAVGPPVGFLESGRTVVHAFRQAFACAVIAVLVLLMLLLRSVADTLRVVLPLLLAGALTVAAMVLLKQPFNFANVIALPLVLGVGVDYGVYLAQRGRAAPAGVNLLQTSTARAVWYGALITIANFGNLMLAPHPGMASMGLLLTLGLCMTLLCTLVVLPGLLVKSSDTSKPSSATG